jgi:hypothetical protein
MITIFMDPKIFFEQNKHCHWTPPPIPEHLVTDIEIANWILNQLDFGWIELDIELDLDQWKKECVYSMPQLVPHRESDSIGWNSACMHGIDVASTGAWTRYGYSNEKEVPYHWTTLSANTPTIKSFWQNQFPSEQYRRIRFMEVEPNGYIKPHSDMPGRLPGEENFDALEFGVPINIAVIHPAECYMTLEGKGVVPFKEGRAFLINIRHTHSVINFSKESRMHVIGHSYGYGSKKQQFAELIVRSYKKQYEHSRI